VDCYAGLNASFGLKSPAGQSTAGVRDPLRIGLATGKGAKGAKDASFFVISPSGMNLPEVTVSEYLASKTWEMSCARAMA
jgi:hypothetical protein